MLDFLDREGVPVLLCLTHADKLYANECLKVVGKDCPEDTATRMIGKELDVSSFLICTIQEYCMFFVIVSLMLLLLDHVKCLHVSAV